jgi:hypothetical protein
MLAPVVDIATVQRWIEKLGYRVRAHGKGTLRIDTRNGEHTLPPFYVQCGDNWVLLSILPVFAAGELLPDDLWRRLLGVNRDMRVAKFALGEDDEVVLCAELPTESLDQPELTDAVTRMVEYYGHYRDALVAPGPTSG